MDSTPTSTPVLFITGCGYVGFAVARNAAARGWKVVALTRNEEKAEALRESGCIAECIVADLANDDWHDRAPAAPDYVLNSVSAGGGGLAGYRRSYLDGMRSLVRWAKERKPGHLIYTGSTGVYGTTDGSVVHEHDVDPQRLSETGECLFETEQTLKEAADAFGSATVLRLAGIYGPGRHYLLDQIEDGKTTFPAESDYPLNLIFLDDIVGAVFSVFDWRTADNGRPFEVFNVSDGHPATKKCVVEWLARRTGHGEITFDPDLEPPRARARKLGGREMPDRIISPEKLLRATGWKPQFPDFRAGFNEILQLKEGR